MHPHPKQLAVELALNERNAHSVNVLCPPTHTHTRTQAEKPVHGYTYRTERAHTLTHTVRIRVKQGWGE